MVDENKVARKIRENKGSYLVSIPKRFLKQLGVKNLGIKAGYVPCNIDMKGGKIIITLDEEKEVEQCG